MGRARRVAVVTGVALALVAAASGAAGDYDAVATHAAAKSDRKATIARPPASDIRIGSPEVVFAFRLPTRNTGEVSVYRSHADALRAVAKAKAIAKTFGVSITDFVFVERNVVLGFQKKPQPSERAEVVGWLRT